MAKKRLPTITSQFSALPIISQSVLLEKLTSIHRSMKAERLSALDKEIKRLKAVKKHAQKKTRAKPKPTHRSRKDRKLTWSGRGSMPRWMREEMKALKLKPDAFLIGRRGK